jgi:hypothetical protein
MQEEDSSNIVSCNLIETDPQLINLFSNVDAHPKTNFIHLPPQQHKNRFEHLLIKDTEI